MHVSPLGQERRAAPANQGRGGTWHVWVLEKEARRVPLCVKRTGLMVSVSSSNLSTSARHGAVRQHTCSQQPTQASTTGPPQHALAMPRPCRMGKAGQRKNEEKKCTHRPRYALAGVEAKSTLEARRNRGTCTLQHDDMHAASDHGKRSNHARRGCMATWGTEGGQLDDSWWWWWWWW
jgi:hypothetical protein